MATKKNTSINGKDYYRIKRVVGHKYVDGKKVAIHKQFYGSSKGDAEKKYKAYLEEQAKAKYDQVVEDDASTLGMRANEYIENVLNSTSKYAPGTKALYKRAYNKHVKDTWIDKMRARDIKAKDLQKFYNELDITYHALESVKKFVNALFKWMAINEYANNITLAVESPEKEKVVHKKGIVVWDDNDLDTVLRLSEGHRHRLLVYMLNYTGMRISELLDLKYSDIEDGVIHITSQLYEGSHPLPKYDSVRDVPMHSKLARELEVHRAWHEEEMRKNGYQSEYIFTTKTGHQYDRHNLNTSMNRFYKSIGVEGNGFHVYRATFCTNLCRAKVPLEVASKLLGHKSLEVTAAHYALIRQDTKQSAIDLLN